MIDRRGPVPHRRFMPFRKDPLRTRAFRSSTTCLFIVFLLVRECRHRGSLPSRRRRGRPRRSISSSGETPYEVLGVARNYTDQEIKSAYRRMALKYHPDKNQNDPVAADMFKVTYSYNILSDPNKRHQYDTSGFEAIDSEGQELELDLSSLGTVNTMFAALFSKLGVPIKTTVSATVLEEALNVSVTSFASVWKTFV